MSKLDTVIAEMYPIAKKYFPRLSSFLMLLYADSPKKNSQKMHREYISLILFSFCNFMKYDQSMAKAFDYAYENLSQEDFLKKNYLGFLDGKLYDKTYSEKYLYSLIEDSAISFQTPLNELKKTSPEEVDVFMKYLLQVIDHVTSKTNVNGDIYCSEYLEQCFLFALRNNLEIYFEYEDSLNNK